MSVSRIAETIRLRHAPVALHWSDDKPDNAVQFEKGGWGCAMFLEMEDNVEGSFITRSQWRNLISIT